MAIVQLADVVDAVNPALLEKELDAVETIPKSESLAIKKQYQKKRLQKRQQK